MTQGSDSKNEGKHIVCKKKALRAQSKNFLLGEPHCGMLPPGKRNNHFLICIPTYVVLGGQAHIWGNWAAFRGVGSPWSLHHLITGLREAWEGTQPGSACSLWFSPWSIFLAAQLGFWCERRGSVRWAYRGWQRSAGDSLPRHQQSGGGEGLVRAEMKGCSLIYLQQLPGPKQALNVFTVSHPHHGKVLCLQ